MHCMYWDKYLSVVLISKYLNQSVIMQLCYPIQAFGKKLKMYNVLCRLESNGQTC